MAHQITKINIYINDHFCYQTWNEKLDKTIYEKKYLEKYYDERIMKAMQTCRSINYAKYLVDNRLDAIYNIIVNKEEYDEWQRQMLDEIVFNIVNKIEFVQDSERFEISFNETNIKFLENEKYVKPPSFTIYDKHYNKVFRAFNIVDLLYEFEICNKQTLFHDYDDSLFIQNNDINCRIIIITARNIVINNKSTSNLINLLSSCIKYNALFFCKFETISNTISNFFIEKNDIKT